MKRTNVFQILIAFILLLAALFGSTHTAYADSVVVTDCSNENQLTTFINGAPAAGRTITFNCGTATIPFTFSKSFNKNITIDGGNLVTLSPNNTYAFQVQAIGTLTLQNITIANGHSSPTGGIENIGTTIIAGSTFTNNHSTNNGGAIANTGTLTVANSTFSGNSATNRGGAINNDGGTVSIVDSTLSGNQAGTQGGAIYHINSGSVTLNRVTISGNSSASDGGGIYSNTNGTDTLTNVTLSGNHATGGGTGGGGIFQNNGNATLKYVTIANNTTVAYGGGLYTNNLNGATMSLQNVLLSGNSVSNCDGANETDVGGNMSSDNTCPFPVNRKNVNTQIGPLANNGGPTLTHMPLPPSPAINAGVCIVGITVDQRGAARPASNCDVGSVEYGVVIPRLYLPLIMK